MNTVQAWAKLGYGDEKRVTAALPLIDHCLDVGTVFEIILRAWLQPLAIAAGRPLTLLDIARLTVLVALHDLGKANRGFQARIDRKRPKIGHTGQVAALLYHSRLRVGEAGKMLQALIGDWGAREHFAAVMAHHGRPLAEFDAAADSGVWSHHADQWVAKADGDPTAHVLTLIDAVRARWPLAWEAGPALPAAPRFVALFAGLVTLADWLGSDTRRFPVEGPHGADRDGMRSSEAQQAAAARGFLPLPTPAGDFQSALGFAPHGFQADAAAADLGPVALIEAETGSGKTEAALWRWLELRRRGEVDGLFFALPTRSAAVQLHKRVNDMLERVWGRGVLEAVLAVPGYLKSGDATGQALPDYAVRWDKGEGGDDDSRWAAERANRFLAARVAVGTIDQALLGTLPVKHALFRAGVLSRSLLVVDEVHASDAYMTGLLDRLLDHHVAVGGRALLLSATLGSAARAWLLKTPCPTLAAAVALPYPALSGRGSHLRVAEGAARAAKTVRVEIAGIIADAVAIAERAVAAAQGGAKVLVVRNSVAGAIAVAQAVAALAPDLAFRVNRVATLHHGRFAPDDRKLLDDRVGAVFGRDRAPGGMVLVGTQTLEQSLDIDADLLLTDLAPMDVLLQRIGRLHRHERTDRGGFAQARVVVLRPADRDLRPLLDKEDGRHGLGSVYRDLRQLEATLRLFEASPDIVIPRDNRRLVEGASHDDALAVVTADWGTAGQNHAAGRSSATAADRNTAEIVALDLSQPFTELAWPPGGEQAMTRLGARDLLIDLDPPLVGPFGLPVARIAIPGWMGIAPGAAISRIDDRQFGIDGRTFAYGAWGLQQVG